MIAMSRSQNKGARLANIRKMTALKIACALTAEKLTNDQLRQRFGERTDIETHLYHIEEAGFNLEQDFNNRWFIVV